MNSRKTYIILVIVLAAVLVGATAGYRAFTEKNQNKEAEEKQVETVSASEEETAETSLELAQETEEEVQTGDTVPAAGMSSAGQQEGKEPEAESPGAGELPVAEDFTVATAEGIKASLSDFAGKPVIVNFWASWCPPCKAELPYFQEAYEEYGKEIQFMMVDLLDGSRETNATAAQFLKETGYTFPVFYDRDGSASYTYEIYSIPVTLGVTAEGELKYTKIGSMSQSDLEEIVAGVTG